MSDSAASRDVIFRMRAEVDKGAAKNAERFGKMLEGTDARAFDAIDKRRATSLSRFEQSTRSMIEAERKATSAIELMINRRTELRRKEFPRPMSAIDSASRPSAVRTVAPSAIRADIPSAIESGRAAVRPRVDSYRADGEAAVSSHRMAVTAIQSEIKAGDKLTQTIVGRIEVRKREGGAAEATSRLTQKELQREHRERDRFTRESVQATEQASTDRLRVQHRETSAVGRSLAERERRLEDMHKRDTELKKAAAARDHKARQHEERESKKLAAQFERDMATATGRVSAANNMLADGIAGSAEGLTRLATGLTALNIAGEENTEALIRKLVTLRAINDTLGGAISTWKQARQVAAGYRDTLTGIAAAQNAIAARQGLDMLPIPGGRAGGRTGGAGGRAGGGFASNTAEFATAQAGLSGLQKAAVRLGGALRPLAALLGNTAIGAAGSAATLAVGLPVIADMMASLATTGSIAPREGSVRESAVGGIGGAAFAVNRLSLQSANNSDAALEELAKKGNATAGALRSERMVARTETGLDNAIRAEAERTKELIELFQEEQSKAQRALMPVMQEAERLSGEQALPAIGKAQRFMKGREQQVERIDVRDEQGHVDAFGALAKAERLLEIERQQIALIEKRGGIERETARTKLESAREDLRLTEQSVERTEDKIRMLRESMLSDAERFADLDKKDQDRVLDAGRRMQAGEIVSTEDRSLVRQYGGEAGGDMARKQAVHLTAQTDFGAVFQQGQQKRMEQLRAKLEGPDGLQVQLNDRRSIVVKHEQDVEHIAERFAEITLRQVEQHDERMISLFDAKLKAESAKNRRDIQADIIGKMGGPRRALTQ